MSRLRVLVTGSLAAVVLTVAGGAAFSSTASADPDPDKACVGAFVSQGAHITQQELGVGFGQYFLEHGVNPGDTIQAGATAVCGKHQ